MKILPLKKLLLSNGPLKIISLFLGYNFWNIASFNQSIPLSICIPLCFNPVNHPYTIKAPETIDIVVRGKRAALHALEKETIAAHINISKLLPGNHDILLNDAHIFLPHNVSLIHYSPTNISITIMDQKIV